jgi:hypothetical protein
MCHLHLHTYIPDAPKGRVDTGEAKAGRMVRMWIATRIEGTRVSKRGVLDARPAAWHCSQLDRVKN